jgi:hypothetical protein
VQKFGRDVPYEIRTSDSAEILDSNDIVIFERNGGEEL